MSDIDELVAALREAHLDKEFYDRRYKETLHAVLREGSDCDVMRATGMNKDAVRMYRKRKGFDRTDC